jgi:ankyrin repeat protein
MAEAARLLEAAFSNDCKALRLYLKKGYDGTARSGKAPRSTLLHQVAMLECSDCDKGSMVRTLIKKGVQVDARDDLGHTALMGCRTKAAAIALLDHGANVQARNEPDISSTALMYAQQIDNLELVQLLIQRGAAVNALTLGHESALSLEALLAAGADVNGGLKAGEIALNGTPLHAAVDVNDNRGSATQQQIIKLLLQHRAEVDACNCCGQTPLMLSAMNGSTELASMLLAAGANVSAVCSQWRITALHYAAELCKVDMLKLLLEKAADPTVADARGYLPLHGACHHGSLEVCTMTHNQHIVDAVLSGVVAIASDEAVPISC